MGALDDHNHQHTYGNSLGTPTSAAGVSAQQSIEAHNRLVESSASAPATGSVAPGWRAQLTFALISGGVSLVAAIAAYAVGGIGAVAIGLVAVGAGLFTVVFSIAAAIEGLKSAAASRNK